MKLAVQHEAFRKFSAEIISSMKDLPRMIRPMDGRARHRP